MKTNTVKTKRKKYKRNSRAMTFRILEDIADAFIEKAELSGYNTTEALELLMKLAVTGLLPPKELNNSRTVAIIGPHDKEAINEFRNDLLVSESENEENKASIGEVK